MSTRTGRTPTKVRANREAVTQYFNSTKDEPEKEGSALKETPSGAHFKLPKKRLLYESANYAVFNIRDGASSSSEDASFHSLREQESIQAPSGFYYGAEQSIDTEDTGRHSGGTGRSTSVSPNRKSQSHQQASGRDSALGAEHGVHSRVSDTGHDGMGTSERGSVYYLANERLSSTSGNVGRQRFSNASELQNEVNSQYKTKSDLQNRDDEQNMHFDTQCIRQQRGEEMSNETSLVDAMLTKGMEQMLMETSSSTKEINQFLYDLWRSQQMCDIIIKVNGKEFHAHKLALAAHSEKFTNRYCEEAPSTISEVIVPNASSAAAEVLINYIYTNELSLTAENIESVIICARKLGINRVLDFCQDFLNSFNKDSVLFLLPIAQRQGFVDVAERMSEFMNKSSLSLMQSAGFLECDMHQVEWLISRDELEMNTELEVFYAVVRWIDHDRNDRIKYAPILIGCVRLIYISPEDLIQHVEPERHIFSIQKCFEMLYFAFRYQAIMFSGSTLFTIIRVPPPRQYAVPVCEHFRTTDHKMSKGTQEPANRTNNTSLDPHHAMESTGRDTACKMFTSKHATTLNTAKSDHDSSTMSNVSNSPGQGKRDTSIGCTPTLDREKRLKSGRQGKPLKDSQVSKRGFRNCEDDGVLPQNLNVIKGNQMLHPKYDPQTSTGSVCRQSSAQDSKKRRESVNSLQTRNLTEYRPCQGNVPDMSSSDSESSGSERSPQPRRIVKKLVPVTPEAEEIKARIKVPKIRTRDRLMSRDRFLVIGGIDPFEVTDYKTSRLVEEYFPSKYEWTTKSSLPDSRHHACACLLNEFVYLIGGSTYSEEQAESSANPTSTCFRYDPDTDNWSRISSLQTPRMYHGGGVLREVLYAVGGHDYTGRELDSVEYYTADTDSWDYAANMTEPKVGVACIGYKSCLLVIGGSVDRGGQKVVLNTVESYDPKLNCWVRKKSLPKPLCNACVLEVNNDLYLLGGITQKKRSRRMWSSDSVYRYTSLCEVWAEFTKMITPRHDAGAVAIGCDIYILGGVSTQMGEAASMEVLDCETGTWEEEDEEEFRPVIGVACVKMPCL